MELPQDIANIINDFARPVQSPFKCRWSWVMAELQFRQFQEAVLIVKLLDLPRSDAVMYFAPILVDFMKNHNNFEECAGEPWTTFINSCHKRVWAEEFANEELSPFPKLSDNMTIELFNQKVFNKHPAKPLQALMPLYHMEHKEEYGTRKQFYQFWQGYARQRELGNIL